MLHRPQGLKAKRLLVVAQARSKRSAIPEARKAAGARHSLSEDRMIKSCAIFCRS